MQYLRQSSTATITLGPFVDATDAVTRETALTVTVKLSKNGGALAARNDATAIVHDADGYYPVVLNATDTGTIGRLRADATAAGALLVWEDFTVLDEAVYDVLFGSVAPSTHTAAAVQTLVAAGAVASVTGSVGSVTAGVALSSTGLDAVVVETGVNARQALAIIGAATAGKASGLDTTTAVFYAMGAAGTTTERISATTTADGNRTATTLTLPA